MKESNEIKMLKKIVEFGYFRTKKYEYKLDGWCVLFRSIGSNTWYIHLKNHHEYLGVK